jgi:FkbM family methyltransferase
VKGGWTLKLLSKWWPVMTPESCFRLLLAHRKQARQGIDPSRTVTLQTRRPNGIRTTIRVAGSDLNCFEETFKGRVYDGACRRRQHHTFIDLRANIGVASQYVAGYNPNCSILAVEPAPENIPFLRLNLEHLIATGQCRILEAAVWSRNDCPLHLSSLEADAEYSALQVKEPREALGDQRRVVRGMTMEAIVRESGFDRVDLLKVDIEGAELQLFSGSLEWLRKVRTVAVEFHGTARQDSRFDEIMKQAGFKVSDENWHTVLAWQD